MKRDEFARALDLVGDVLLPAGRGRPAPSTIGMGGDLVDRLRDRERDLLVRALDELGAPEAFGALDSAARVHAVAEFERSKPALFDVLRRCIYFGYYAQPAVIRSLRAQGYDINESPQPRGYTMPALRPDAVDNIDRQRLVWIPADKVGMPLKEAS